MTNYDRQLDEDIFFQTYDRPVGNREAIALIEGDYEGWSE